LTWQASAWTNGPIRLRQRGTKMDPAAPRNSCNLQELRGGYPNQVIAWMNGPIRLPQAKLAFGSDSGPEQAPLRNACKLEAQRAALPCPRSQ